MAGLALDYAKKGDAKRGMDFITRARGIDKSDPELIYIQAVVENLSKEDAKALATLREAMEKGYPIQEAQSDPELANLQNRPEFKNIEQEFAANSR